MPSGDNVIHDSCPQGHPYAYVTSRGFGWCRECQKHSPTTLEGEAALEELRAEGKGRHIDRWEPA